MFSSTILSATSLYHSQYLQTNQLLVLILFTDKVTHLRAACALQQCEPASACKFLPAYFAVFPSLLKKWVTVLIQGVGKFVCTNYGVQQKYNSGATIKFLIRWSSGSGDPNTPVGGQLSSPNGIWVGALPAEVLVKSAFWCQSTDLLVLLLSFLYHNCPNNTYRDNSVV